MKTATAHQNASTATPDLLALVEEFNALTARAKELESVSATRPWTAEEIAEVEASALRDQELRAAIPSHPYAQFTLIDAVRLANDNRSLNLLQPISSLTEAREVVLGMFSRVTHIWATGMAALDVLDAAIDGRDLRKSCRLC